MQYALGRVRSLRLPTPDDAHLGRHFSLAKGTHHMPSGFLVDPERSLVLSRAWGVFTVGDALSLGRSVVEHPAFRPQFRWLADFSRLTQLDIPIDVVRYFAATNPLARSFSGAVVASSDVVFGIARLYGTSADLGHHSYHVFRTLTEAVAWLGFEQEQDILRERLDSLTPPDLARPASP